MTTEINLTSLMATLGYQFKDLELLARALTHRSIPGQNNERLEFLGDAVLGVIIAQELFQRHPKSREGELSRLRAALVNREMLAKIAGDLELSNHLLLGVGEKKSGGAMRASILSDAVEAIIGAIYIDADYQTCRGCVLRWYGERIEDFAQLKPKKDPKSALQEWLQAHKFPLPDYSAEITGKAHAQTFTITCRVEGLPHETQGKSTSRRKAEQIAAQLYLDKLHER